MPTARTANGLRLQCRLTPRSGHDEVKGIREFEDGSILQCAVRAIPEKGKANLALVQLIANWLEVPKASVSIVAGSKSRRKTVEIAGSPDLLEAGFVARIDELIQEKTEKLYERG